MHCGRGYMGGILNCADRYRQLGNKQIAEFFGVCTQRQCRQIRNDIQTRFCSRGIHRFRPKNTILSILLVARRQRSKSRFL